MIEIACILLNVYYVVGSVLSAENVLLCLIFSITLGERY